MGRATGHRADRRRLPYAVPAMLLGRRRFLKAVVNFDELRAEAGKASGTYTNTQTDAYTHKRVEGHLLVRREDNSQR